MKTFQILDTRNSFNSTDTLTDRASATRELAARIGAGDPQAIQGDGRSATDHAADLLTRAETVGELRAEDLRVIVNEEEATPRLTYRERRERRAERRRSWAEGRAAKADSAHQAAHDATAGIPFGQPILVGHHSERRHRNAVERGQRKASQAVEHSDMARRHTEAADTIERQLDRSIYDDDGDAVERLRERIEQREARRETMKKENAAYRKEHRAELKALTPYGRSQAVPHPGWELSNLGGCISRDKKRLQQLERQAAA